MSLSCLPLTSLTTADNHLHSHCTLTLYTHTVHSHRGTRTPLLFLQELDDPLEQADMLMQQLEQLPSICRYQYKDVGAFVMGFIEPKAAEYKVGLYRSIYSY